MGAASYMTFNDWAAYLSVLNLNLGAKNKFVVFFFLNVRGIP